MGCMIRTMGDQPYLLRDWRPNQNGISLPLITQTGALQKSLMVFSQKFPAPLNRDPVIRYCRNSLPILRVGLTRNWSSSPFVVLVITQ